ncbi:hypothetical protein BMS3Bbin07_00693 [bacterium BMS3Bbin07]|nr:hypothetical protein BMS3Bbin07_00693 [bacterium BMS3Bbin07]
MQSKNTEGPGYRLNILTGGLEKWKTYEDKAIGVDRKDGEGLWLKGYTPIQRQETEKLLGVAVRRLSCQKPQMITKSSLSKIR